MLLGTVQIAGETLTSREVGDICESFESQTLRLLSLRGCKIMDRDFKKMMTAFGNCTSIVNMNLNLKVISHVSRTKLLAEALYKNRSLRALFLHGNHIGDEGMEILYDSLSMHPSLVSLDMGDCRLGDKAIRLISNLLPDDGAKPGLKELTLSANPSISPSGWAHFAVALAAGSSIKLLNLDYNNIGDYGSGLLAVAIASSKTLEVIDLEATGVTQQGGEVLLDLVQNYPTPLRELNLTENYITVDVEVEINELLGYDDEESDDDDEDVSDDDEDKKEEKKEEDVKSKFKDDEKTVPKVTAKEKASYSTLRENTAEAFDNYEKEKSTPNNSGEKGNSSTSNNSGDERRSSSHNNNSYRMNSRSSSFSSTLSNNSLMHMSRNTIENRSVSWRSPPVSGEHNFNAFRNTERRKYRPLPVPGKPVKA
ncbi:leucine-rich repeat-containing protein 73-like [Saccoglossus kowalevskii]|uniref:Leucine-rich repeat-containing protein 73-like n=1 Tax=Saccoglossus kowalevskii TaxID=10224 RepID=A0ABM0GV99_SACKO|nr:PREDICTED: leucine-rich repeat-containing protein 73-like [Saccoglossus kowalevskii]